MRSLLGWLILLAALAVPAVLFWNWWSQMNARQASEAAAPKAAAGGPEPGAGPFAAPAGPSTPQGSAAPSGELASSATSQAGPEPSSAAQPQTAAAPLAPGTTESLALRYAPSRDWDPTLSPLDRERLKPKPVEIVKGPEPPPPPRRRSCEDRIQLYGTVATPNGIAALINDGVYKQGDAVAGAVVLRITTRQVDFRCGTRPFTLKVNK